MNSKTMYEISKPSTREANIKFTHNYRDNDKIVD